MKKRLKWSPEFDHVWDALEHERPKARVGAVALINMASYNRYVVKRALAARAGKPHKRFKNRRG